MIRAFALSLALVLAPACLAAQEAAPMASEEDGPDTEIHEDGAEEARMPAVAFARRISGWPISPALPGPRREEWAYAGFKGGSEPGVLNLTWLLQSRSGEWSGLAMTWNDPDEVVDPSKFELLAQRLLSLPR